MSAARRDESTASLLINKGTWWEGSFVPLLGPPVPCSDLTWTTKSYRRSVRHLAKQEEGQRRAGLTPTIARVVPGTTPSPLAQAPQHAFTLLDSWHCHVCGRRWVQVAPSCRRQSHTGKGWVGSQWREGEGGRRKEGTCSWQEEKGLRSPVWSRSW